MFIHSFKVQKNVRQHMKLKHCYYNTLFFIYVKTVMSY